MDNDLTTVTNLARLARLDISSEEQSRLVNQLPKILAYVGQLKTVTTTGVPAIRDEAVRLRHDQASASQTIDQILDQAPDRLDRFWRVNGVFS